MTSNAPHYNPISCEFHDVLEALATVRRPASISFHDDDGALQQRTAIIHDVYSRDGAEYLSLSSGETLRLDQLVEVDGNRLTDFFCATGSGDA